MKDFDITMTHYNRGDIITGTIVMIGAKEVTVAIGGLREGVFPREELDPAFKLGDAILVMVTGEIDEKGCLVMTHANVNKAIQDREKLKNLKVTINCKFGVFIREIQINRMFLCLFGDNLVVTIEKDSCVALNRKIMCTFVP